MQLETVTPSITRIMKLNPKQLPILQPTGVSASRADSLQKTYTH